MVWTRYQFAVATGSVLSCAGTFICVKWSSKEEAKGWDGKKRTFYHPFLYTQFLFVADFLCLILFRLLYIYLKRRNDGSEERNKFTRGNHEFNRFLAIIPTICEVLGISLQLIGLDLTHAASFQMIKTSVILFTAILRISILKKKTKGREWLGIFIVIGGLILVCLADMATPQEGADKKKDIMRIIIGDVLVFLSQIAGAVYYVSEEFLLSGSDAQPLEVIGWEGIWGLIMMSVLLIIFYFIPCPEPIANNSRQVLEDPIDAFIQIHNNTNLQILVFSYIITMSICQIMGLNLTKEFSSVTRPILDSLRIILLYVWGLIVFGQKFHYLHLIGFFVIFFGVLLHNNAINMNTVRWIGRKCHCMKSPPEEESRENVEEQAEKGGK